MEVWLSQLLSWIAAITVLAIGIVLFVKQLEAPKGKDYKNKAILKELLEAYGLDIPTELEDLENPITSQIDGK